MSAGSYSGPNGTGGTDLSVTDAQNMGELVSSGGGGELGFQYLMSDDPDERGRLMANASLLSDEEWKTISDTVRQVRKERVRLIEDLRGAGLDKSLSLATYNDVWPTVSSFGGAKVGMNPGDNTEETGVRFGEDGAPLPVIHAQWHIDRRRLLVSRATGTDISTLVPTTMTQNVGRKFNELAFNGWNRTVNGYEMYGFLNHPDRNQVAAPGVWDDDTSDPEDIRNTYLTAIEALEDDLYDGGNYWVYHNRAEYQALRRITDTIGQGEQNMRARINEEFGNEIAAIRQSPFVPEGEAVIFQPSPDVVNVGIAENIQPVQWDHPAGFRTNFKIFMAANLELYSDPDGRMGLAHVSGM